MVIRSREEDEAEKAKVQWTNEEGIRKSIYSRTVDGKEDADQDRQG